MTEVWCANLDCKANENGKCISAIIHLHAKKEFPLLECKCYVIEG